MRAFRVFATVAVLLSSAFASSAGAAASSGRYIVGYDDGNDAAALLAIQAAGGEVRRTSPELHFAVVTTNDAATFERLIVLSPAVRYVEVDDATRLAGAQWNGAEWNGAEWNGAEWNGAQWNGAEWNGAEWNGAHSNGARGNSAEWNGAQWNAFNWTLHSFREHRDARFQYDFASSDPGLLWQWGVWETGTHSAWETTYGKRQASLCVLDSGVAARHRDIEPNFEAAYNAIDPAASAEDDAGHGTHIAGIAAAAVGNAFGVAGVGNVRILSAKVLSSDGTGYESDLAFGLAWCAGRDAEVAVMALSVTEPGPTLDRALEYNAERDVLLVASAGNGGACTDCVAYPASDARVLGVSAVDVHGNLAPFSSQGPQVDLAAPGIDVLGPFPGDSFAFGSGTSQAVAFVAGAAALLRDHEPLTAAQAWEELLRTATDVGPPGRDNETGAGVLSVEGALAT